MKEYIKDGNEHFTVANFKAWTREMFYEQYAGNSRADLPAVWDKIQAELRKIQSEDIFCYVELCNCPKIHPKGIAAEEMERLKKDLAKISDDTESNNQTSKQDSEDLTDKGTDESTVSKQRVPGSRNRSKHTGPAI